MAPETMQTEETALIRVDDLNAIELFTAGGIDNVIAQIAEKAEQHVPDADTETGRKAIASLAYKVARSKTILDDLGKDLVSDWKAKAKKVDAERKKCRDELDALKARVRQPLTDWEEAEKAREEAERLAAEKEIAEDEAYAEYELRERERIVAEREAELRRQEEERKAKEEAERQAREQKEREEQIAREAEERAKRDTEMKLQKEREARERAEREKIEAEARAKAEKEAAVREAERKAKEEADRKERERLEAEAKAKAEAERKAANKRHRTSTQNGAIQSLIDQLTEYGCGNGDCDVAELARYIVTWIDEGSIQDVTINY